MAQFQAFAQGVQVNGETVLSVVNGMGAFKNTGMTVLAGNGIPNPQAGEWYPQQSWLNAFKEIADKVGGKTLQIIGQAIPSSAKWPPAVDTVEKALSSIDIAYHMNHRGGEIGYYKFESTGPNSGKMVCKNPYPSDFDFGIIYAVARKFAPSGTATVEFDSTAPCRKSGADSCTYLVTWK